MLPYLSSVMPLVAYAQSVREFIHKLLQRFLPAKCLGRIIPGCDVKFGKKIEDAFFSLDEKVASENDYRAKVVEVLCEEVTAICKLTKSVCENRGYEEYAEEYLSTDRFIKLLLRSDRKKLKRLNAALSDEKKELWYLLCEIGAILDDRDESEKSFTEKSEIKKANAEIIALQNKMKESIDTGFSDVKSGIALLNKKIDKCSFRGKKRGQYTDEKVAFCVSCVETAKDNMTLRCSVNGKITLKNVFTYYQRKLEEYDVKSYEEFAKIIHAYRAKQSRARIKQREGLSKWRR